LASVAFFYSYLKTKNKNEMNFCLIFSRIPLGLRPEARQIRIKTLLPWLLPRTYDAAATYAKARARLR
jgi:hypothetical protein